MGLISGLTVEAIRFPIKRILVLVQVAGVVLSTALIITIVILVGFPNLVIILILLAIHIVCCAVCCWPWPLCYGLQVHWHVQKLESTNIQL